MAISWLKWLVGHFGGLPRYFFGLYLKPIEIFIQRGQLFEEVGDFVFQLRAEHFRAGGNAADASDLALPGKVRLQRRIVCGLGTLVQLCRDGLAHRFLCGLDEI